MSLNTFLCKFLICLLELLKSVLYGKLYENLSC